MSARRPSSNSFSTRLRKIFGSKKTPAKALKQEKIGSLSANPQQGPGHPLATTTDTAVLNPPSNISAPRPTISDHGANPQPPDPSSLIHSTVTQNLQHQSTYKPRLPSVVDPLSSTRLPPLPSSRYQIKSDELAPDIVSCILIVAYGKEILDNDGKRFRIKWQDNDSYQILDNAATECLIKNSNYEPKCFYRKNGRCRLIRHDSDKAGDKTKKEWASEILENPREWSEVLPLMIMRFCSQNPYVKFHLEIRWEYSGLQIQKIRNEKYAVTIANVLLKNMRINWEGKKFIPRGDLDQIFTRDTIAELVDEDETLHDGAFIPANGGRPLDKEKFINDVTAVASRLLALCVYVGLPLACLHKMMVQGLEDIAIPLTKANCPHDSYERQFDLALMIQGGFVAHKFELNKKGRPEHQSIPPDVVVPIMFDLGTDKLGEGSFGKVFKVRIDCDHHFFSSDRDELFALKIFFEQGSRTSEDFENERRTLKKMADAPHPHITSHLASWTQNDKFYMLFPRAEENLRNFLRNRPHPSLTKENVLFLLSQMKGLAEGVRRIHILAPSGLGPHTLNRNLSVAAEKEGSTGFHHDLKPANILVFASKDIGGFTFKISDFGSARIGAILSGSNANQQSFFTRNLSPGDPEYAAPDSELVKRTSRPYDIWSMGCIFLEILMWTLGISESDLSAFETARLTSAEDHNGNQDTAFWYKPVGGADPCRKPAVDKQLQRLTQYCQNRGVFEHLIATIVKMLTISPSERIDAPNFCNALDAILLQAEHDLEQDEEFYLNDIGAQDKMAAPPTSFPDDQSRGSETPSIDARILGSAYGNTLGVELQQQRRATISSGSRSESPANDAKRAGSHTRHLSLPTDAKSGPARRRLSLINTQNLLPSDELSRSPSISVSEYGDQNTTEDPLREVGGQDEITRRPPAGWDSLNIAREDMYQTLRKKRSRDSQSI